MGKRNKDKQVFTPSDLEALENKHERQQVKDNAHKIYTRVGAQRTATDITKTVKWQKRTKIALIIVILIAFILYLLSLALTQWGDLVISVDRNARGAGLILSENSDMKDASPMLSAPSAEEVTNITYAWLPFDIIDKQDGSYNGENYLAYTFYLSNNGKEKVSYEGMLEITGASKSVDEAVRILIYKNGDPYMYGKMKKGTKDTPEEDATVFLEEAVVMKTTSDINPGDIDKYTVVSWVEGNDPECVDDIMGGYIRMSMLFSIADEQE